MASCSILLPSEKSGFGLNTEGASIEEYQIQVLNRRVSGVRKKTKKLKSVEDPV